MLPEGDLSDQDALDVLEKVELRRFTATPGAIEPFEASLLEWEVTGPGGFAVLLDGTTVGHSGQKPVTPLTTRTFRLRARVRDVSQVLGTLTVQVDAGACRILPIPNLVVQQNVQTGIDDVVATTPGLSRRKPDVVTVDQGGIGVRLFHRQEIDSFPNPEVNVEAHWTYRVANGELFASFDRLDVDIRFPWWVWLLPPVYPGLSIAIDMAKDSTRSRILRQAEDGARQLESIVPGGLRILAAAFTVTNFEIQACPEQSLRKIVAAGLPITFATPA